MSLIRYLPQKIGQKVANQNGKSDFEGQTMPTEWIAKAKPTSKRECDNRSGLFESVQNGHRRPLFRHRDQRGKAKKRVFVWRRLRLVRVTPEFITHETLTPRETRGWRHLVFILRSTTPLTYQNR